MDLLRRSPSHIREAARDKLTLLEADVVAFSSEVLFAKSRLQSREEEDVSRASWPSS